MTDDRKWVTDAMNSDPEMSEAEALEIRRALAAYRRFVVNREANRRLWYRREAFRGMVIRNPEGKP